MSVSVLHPSTWRLRRPLLAAAGVSLLAAGAAIVMDPAAPARAAEARYVAIAPDAWLADLIGSFKLTVNGVERPCVDATFSITPGEVMANPWTETDWSIVPEETTLETIFYAATGCEFATRVSMNKTEPGGFYLGDKYAYQRVETYRFIFPLD